MKRYTTTMAALLFFLTLWPIEAMSGVSETGKVREAATVLSELVQVPEDGIPPALLGGSCGIAIIPDVLKAGFIIGGRYGTGVLVVRNTDGSWSNPVFIRIVGGSLGWQIGAQATDIILVFRSMRSIEGVASGKFTLGADASVAAGPVGRQAEAATDIQLRAEILSYSRNRGLFAGLSLEGSAVQVDYDANTAFYATAGLLPFQIFRGDGSFYVPEEAEQLKQLVTRYSSR